MADEIDFENRRISNLQRHVTLTLTLDRAIWHTVVHHSSTSTYTHQISFESEKLLWTDVHTVGGTDIEAGFIRSTWMSRPKNERFIST